MLCRITARVVLQAMVRLLADGVVDRWTRDKRRAWGEARNEAVMNGLLPLPKGIGLSDVVPKPEK